MKKIALLLTLALGALLLVAVDDLPNWGQAHSPANDYLSPYYIENSMAQTSVPNFVTSVLADYRGYDTMFETTVIFCAGITVLSLLRRTHRKTPKVVKPRPDRQGADLILKAATKIGMRLTTKQLAKYVPFAGQIVAATVGYAAIRYLGEEHMKDCIRVAQQAQLEVPLLGYSA